VANVHRIALGAQAKRLTILGPLNLRRAGWSCAPHRSRSCRARARGNGGYELCPRARHARTTFRPAAECGRHYRLAVPAS
jgi:hypothetical protein